MHARFLLISAAFLALPIAAQTSQPAQATEAAATAPFVRAEAEAVVAKLAAELEDNFVFPEVGRNYSAMLRSNLAAGKYSAFDDADAFAETVTKDLQSIHKDRHLRLHPPRLDAAGTKVERRGPPPDLNAISKSGWLADGVAYVRFEGFPGNEATLAALADFLAEYGSANTLIIDARSHRGGGFAEMDLLFPQLYAKPTVLVAMDTRQSVFESDEEGGQEFALRRITAPAGVVRQEHYVEPAAQPTGLREAKIYLLTSNRTASAGEHLSLSLKRTNRATLIGETTRGAGHYGGFIPLGHGYSAFIPVGRTFDPHTGEGWEGVGVKPDIAVAADKALDEALKLAGVEKSAEVALAELK